MKHIACGIAYASFIGWLLPSPVIMAQTQAGADVRFQENADCGGRGKGTHDDVTDLDRLSPPFGISCVDVIARDADSYVVFYSEPGFSGDELWVRGQSRNTDIASIKRSPCVTAGIIDYWNDSIRSVRFMSGNPPRCATVIGSGPARQPGAESSGNNRGSSIITYHNGSIDSILYVYATFAPVSCGFRKF